ncbi:unnamed protein product [Parnassius apollo]|uniref:(apollo) hypothetical protein n=1 Tax=Parnassius apollo TaxID=110799 RepID=A0A8S3X5E0_PARAO|nr:unnamed protein product [Parnassius apollo]
MKKKIGQNIDINYCLKLLHLNILHCEVMNGDISVEASRPRPLSGGIWTLFSWLRRDERSFSDESLSSVGSDRTAVSFAFLEPLHYKAAIEPIVLPPLSPPTDSYKKRVRDRNFRRQRERDITLHRKYGLFKGENSDRYDVLSLPPARRNILNSSDKVERGRRATSETFQRRAPYVPGKRRAPLPPTVTTSLPRNLSRKRPAPPPPTKLTEIPKQSIELCAESMNTKPGCDKPSSSSKNVSINAKIERNNREEKIKSDKSFLKQIFENRKRNSAIETNYVKLLPNISELDKQAAKIVEDKKLKVLEGNAVISMSGTNSTSADNVKEKWICTLCLRRYNSAVSSCLYCVKNEKQTHEPFKDNVNISPNVPANIYTQTDNELLNVASTSKAGLSEEKKKLKEMLKEMKDSLPKRPKHSIIDTESPTLRIGSTPNHKNISTLNIEPPPKNDNTFIKSLDKLKVQNTEENVSIVALKGCVATNKNGLYSHPSSSNITTNYPVKEITPQSEYKNTGQKEFQTPDTSTEITNKNIFFNHQSNVSSEMVNIPLTNLKTTNQCNDKQNETDSLFQPKDSFSKFEFIKEKVNNTQLEFQPNLSKSKISSKIKKESQSSIIIKNTPKPLEVMHSVMNKAALDSDLSDNIQMRRINTQENNIKPEALQTKIALKSSICNKPKTNVEKRKNENNPQHAPEVHSKLKEESDEIGKSKDKTKTPISSLIDAPSIHTPLKISSLLNSFYLPAQTNRVNIETPININKTMKSNVTPLTSSDILQQPSNVSISKSPKSVKEISERNEKENTSKEINSASNIITNDQYSTNTSVCKVLGVTPSSLSKEINNNNLGKIDHHFRRRELVNQLEQSIAKGDEQSAADAAVKLAKLRLSCSVLSFSSQIVGNVPTTSNIDMPILKPNENETNKIIKSDLDEKHKKQNVESKSIKQSNLQLKYHITKSSNKNNEHVPKASTSIVGDQENKTRTNRVISSVINVPCEPSTSKSNPVENGTISRARKQSLADEYIAAALEDGADNEDGLDFDDDNLADPDFVPELETFEDDNVALDIDMDSLIETLEDDHENPSTSAEISPSNISVPQLSPGQDNQQMSNEQSQGRKKPAKLILRWKKKNLELNAEQLMFKGNKTLGPDLLELDTPIQFFLYLFLQELIQKIAEETNLYRVQKDPNSTSRMTEMDVRQFIGVVYVMSLIQLPRVTNHWSPILADVKGIDVSTVAWKDNKIVVIASTFAGQKPEADVRRWDKQNSKYVTIKRPYVVGEYNRHMGGVDLIDSIMGIYKIRLRSKRWQVRLFYHYLDLTMANAWLLYIRVSKFKNLSASSILSSADFRQEVAMTLYKMGTKSGMSGRRSLETEIQAKKRKGPAQYVPPMAVRQDQIGHWPQCIQIWIEDKEATRGPVNLRIPRQAVMGELRLQAEKSLGLDSRLQRWIIGRTLCLDDTVPLVSLAGPDLSAPFYLCLVESESNKGNATGEQAKEHEQDKQNNIIDNTREVYTALMKLEQQAIVANTESFECNVCMEECEAGKGAVLRECIHTFCRDCLSDAVRHCEEPIVSCPATGCSGILQEREIRALLPTEEYERWLARGLATAECGTRNAFHCRTPDCTGWALCEPGVRKFPCPVCKCNNCVPCQAIHEAETCEQYQIKLRTAVTAAQTNETDEGTKALLNSLIRRGEALECPECHAIITKKWGCDWVWCGLVCCCDVENTAWLEFEAPSCDKDEGLGCKGAGVGCDKGESPGCGTVCGCDSGEYLEK